MLDERLNEREADSLYRAAIDGGAILDSLGLSWWLSHGSLMGAWRYGGIIPGDDDLDVAVPLDSVSFIEREAAARGWEFLRLAPYLAKIWNPLAAMYRSRYPWSWPYVDLALYERVGDKVWIEFDYHTRREAFAVEDVRPFKRTGFGPIVCPVPHNPDAILNVIYPNWQVKPPGRYQHRTETALGEDNLKGLS